VSAADLKPQTTYYYTIGSMQATGESDGVKSSINHFTTGLQLPYGITRYRLLAGNAVDATQCLPKGKGACNE
jgi:hypothetical protein